MQLTPTDTEAMLQRSARKFFSAKAPLARVRGLPDDAQGFSRELWAEMAELGWTGLLLPEAYEGAAMGLSELCVLLEEAGRELAPEPFLSTVLLAGHTLMLAGADAQRERWLPAIAAGEAILTLAHGERRSRHARWQVSTTALAEGDAFVLCGQKTQVLDAHVADAIIVSARSSGAEGARAGLSLFVVTPETPGVRITRQRRIDGRNAALVELDHVRVGPEELLGELDRAADVLDPTLDRATVGVAAEMLGAMTRAFEDTVAYLKQRTQFGVPIGSFQALQHRAARMYLNVTLARATVIAAARAADHTPAELPALASMAKARCSETFVDIADEGVQLFGGVGMTEEYDIGLFLKRARVAEQTLGDAAWHRARWASLAGY